MQTLKVTKILIIILMLVVTPTARAETVVSNVVSVSSNSGESGEASVNTSVVSTVNGETTEYHYSLEGESASTTYVEVVVGDEPSKEVRGKYLELIEHLLNLIDLLREKS